MSVATTSNAAANPPSKQQQQQQQQQHGTKKKTLKLRRLFQNIHPGINNNHSNSSNHHQHQHASLEESFYHDDDDDDARLLFDNHHRIIDDDNHHRGSTSFDTRRITTETNNNNKIGDDDVNAYPDDHDRYTTRSYDASKFFVVQQAPEAATTRAFTPTVSQPKQPQAQQQPEKWSNSPQPPPCTASTTAIPPTHLSPTKKGLLPENKNDSVKKQRPVSFRVRAPAQPISNVDPPPSSSHHPFSSNNNNNSNKSSSDVTESSIQLNPYARQVAIIHPYQHRQKNASLFPPITVEQQQQQQQQQQPKKKSSPEPSSSATTTAASSSMFHKRTPVFEKSSQGTSATRHPQTQPVAAQFFPPSTRDTPITTKPRISSPTIPTHNVEMQLRTMMMPPRMETPDIFDGLEEDEEAVDVEKVAVVGEEDDDKTARNHNLLLSKSSIEDKILIPIASSSPVRNSRAQPGGGGGGGGGENSSTYSVSSSVSRNNMLLHSPGQEILKAALSRNFGREYLPKSTNSTTASPSYFVKVHPAEWDADRQWKYRIVVQQEPSPPQRQTQSEELTTTAMTCRTVADFFWLEKALNLEYHGSLIIPILEIALSQPYVTAVSSPVEPEKLQDWLSDVLNHVRGNGEWMMTKFVNLVQYSQAVETFLYRHHIILTPDDAPSEYASPVDRNKDRNHNNNKGVLGNIMDMISSEFLCAGGGGSSHDHLHCNKIHEEPFEEFLSSSHNPNGNILNRVGGELWSCTSRAHSPIRTAQDREPHPDPIFSISTTTTTRLSPHHSNNIKIMKYTDEVIEAEQRLVLQYRQQSMFVMEKLQELRDCEEVIGLAWRRFAASLEDLFRYEKTVETFKISDPKIKNLPFRKIEGNLEIQSLAHAKLERSSTSLTILSSMMRAFIGDLCAVEPSVDTYRHAIVELREKRQQQQSPRRQQKTTERNMDESSTQREELLLQKHEKMLRISLTTMCRTTPFRTARMAWRYLHTEASQCAHVNSTVTSLRRKIDVVSQSSISKMLKRHAKEEKVDSVTEIELIQRIVNLGAQRTLPNEKNAGGGTNDDDGSTTVPIENELMVEVDNDSMVWARAKAHQRDRAMEIGRQRIGRWDAKLAMAIMEAVGVDDPNVRVEETTKELRLVRKFAIGLRENLNKCVESIHQLQEAVVTGKCGGSSSHKEMNAPNHAVATTISKKESISLSPKINKIRGSANRIRALREEFLHELLLLFSGMVHESTRKEGIDEPSKTKSQIAFQAVLTSAGIDTRDPYGWIPSQQQTASFTHKTGVTATSGDHAARVGDAIVQYWKTRDAQLEWLLTSMSDLLEEYYQRVEAVESFVYKECVGIQLEKHFSVRRAKSLSEFEKKTDLTAAMNVATRKRMFALRNELQQKLDALGPEVSHTSVKEAKEAHLESKEVKACLHELALRRLTRARETSTERIVTLLAIWAKEEEIGAKEEIKAVSEALSVLEKTVCKDDVEGTDSRGSNGK